MTGCAAADGFISVTGGGARDKRLLGVRRLTAVYDVRWMRYGGIVDIMAYEVMRGGGGVRRCSVAWRVIRGNLTTTSALRGSGSGSGAVLPGG